MGPFDFLEYPEYFPLFMIWASGYVFNYCVFGKSRGWKNLDTTLKLVLALVSGLAIEFCLILPAFYLNINNLQVSIFLPAIEKTWIYHWMITLIVSIPLGNRENRIRFLKAIHFLFSKILSFLFVGWAFVSAILVLEFFYFYPLYIQESTFLEVYFFINIIFASFGWLFCTFFPIYIQNAYDEELSYRGIGYTSVVRRKIGKLERTLLQFSAKLIDKTRRFSSSKKRFIPSVIILFVVFSIIPLDSYLNIFTPKLKYYYDVDIPTEQHYLSVHSSCNGYNEQPDFSAEFQKTTADTIQIAHGNYDPFNELLIPIPENCLGKEVKIGHYYEILQDPNQVKVVFSEDLQNNVVISPLPENSNPTRLRVNYEKLGKQDFNLTLFYLENTIIENIQVLPEKVVGIEFNATYDTWIQEFQIINLNEAFDIRLREFSYDRLNFDEVDENSITLYWNGNEIEYAEPVLGCFRNLNCYILRDQTANLTLSFLSTNKFPS